MYLVTLITLSFQCNGTKTESRQTAHVLLPGEVMEHLQDNVTCVATLSNFATGVLYVTNYRLIFKGAFCHVSIVKVV